MCEYCGDKIGRGIFISQDEERRLVAHVNAEDGILQILCISMQNGQLVTWEDCKPINFCPMCGKKF